MSGTSPLRTELDRAVVADAAPSARNLIVTVVGDAIAPHGVDTGVGVAALGRLLSSFGVSERLVRTTLSRLVHDGILDVESIGRRSYYKVAAAADEMFEHATERIYGEVSPPWDGRWRLVIFDETDAAPSSRSDWKAALAEHGFGAVASNAWASAWGDVGDLAHGTSIVGSASDALGPLADHAIALTTPVSEQSGGPQDLRIARRVYPIEAMEAEYDLLVSRFSHIEAGDVADLPPEDAFKLRMLLVSAYRRIRLGHPPVPAEVLPVPWVGDAARDLVARLYASCADPSERFLAEVLAMPGSVLEPPGLRPLAIDLTTRFHR